MDGDEMSDDDREPSGPDAASSKVASADAPEANAEIMNEAGFRPMSVGYASSFALPITVSNLSNPGALQVLQDYRVGRIGGPHYPVLCTSIHGDTATFAG